MKVTSRVCRFAALALVLGGLAYPATAASAAAKARIHLVGIERDGTKTAVDATIYGTDYIPIFTGGKAVSVPLGTAWIGAEVLTLGPGDSILSSTLVLRRVDITHSETIDLDARAGKLVTFSLDVPGATDTTNSVQACIGGNFVTGPGVGAGVAAVPLYAVPVRSSDVTFGYSSAWSGATASYLIAGQSAKGIPSSPVYRGSPAKMARLQVSFDGGEAVGGYSYADLQSTDSCGLGGALTVPNAGLQGTLSETEYVSPGSYTVSADAESAFWQSSHRMLAGHSYATTFGAAAWGPYQDFPSVQASHLVFWPMAPISDPAQDSSTCCDISTISLYSGGRLLKKSTLSEWHATRAFSYSMTGRAWYTLDISARRRIPGVTIPADVLSPRDSLVWRFRAGPTSGTNFLLVPVTATRFVPQGLNSQNQALPGGTTVVALHVIEPRALGYQSPPRYAVRSVRFEVSFNGGKTWQAVKVTGGGTSWKATVSDPSGGYVALRSTVTDSAGDSTTETIYRAYAVS